MVKVKICGIKDEKVLKLAVNGGYDAIGSVINVDKSPRNISAQKADELFRNVPPFVTTVAVIVPKSIDDVKSIEKIIEPDIIQIHGFFEENFYKEIKNEVSTKIISALLLDDNGQSQNLDNDPFKAIEILEKYSNAILIDKFVPNKLGGTGVTVNWELAKEISNKTSIPIILGGGLKQENVISAIQKVNPYAVDVSSGLEMSPGIKDPKKIINFIKTIKEANL